MKKILKIALILLLVVIVGIGVWVAANWRDISAFLPMASGAYAKFMCSSIFVEGKTEEAAHNWARLALPVSSCVVDYEKKTVTVKGLGHKNTARYAGARFGCTLE
ncbi:MAG TPA: hypothetical protein PLZ78_11530 [Spirochaetota bacterium]|nr:hypothetical protein [Spirochaetota bacterium]